MSYFHEYECAVCSRKYDLHIGRFLCTDCGSPLLVEYDLYRARNASLNLAGSGSGSMWNFRELLPLGPDAEAVSLGEGNTPVYPLAQLAKAFGIKSLWMKDESRNPGGSRHDREMSVMFSSLREMGYQTALVESIGTLGISASMYSAASQRQCLVMIPEQYPDNYEIECRQFDANTKRISWDTSSRKRVKETVLAHKTDVFDITEMGYPFRIEGAKTIFYEVLLQRELPEILILPVSDGVQVVGLWKAIQELKQLGLLRRVRLPAVWLVQNSASPALYYAQKGIRDTDLLPEDTQAFDLVDANGLLMPLVKMIIKQYEWQIIQVDEEKMHAARLGLAHREGLPVSLEGGACLAAVQQMLHLDSTISNRRIWVINPSSGIRQTSFTRKSE